VRARSRRNAPFAGLAAITLALLGACAGAAQDPKSPVLAAEEDASSPLGDADVPLTIDSTSMKRTLRAPVLSIAAVAGAAGWFDVTLDGDDAPATRTLRVGTRARLPFTAGDTLDTRWDRHQVGWDAWEVDLDVRDAAGSLWAGVYTSMEEREGWAFEPLPAADGAPCRVAVTHLGRRAVIPTGAWRKLETSDGPWAIAADCPPPSPFDPSGPPVPDYSPAPTVVQISRLGRPSPEIPEKN
jgi:hypothetical protein